MKHLPIYLIFCCLFVSCGLIDDISSFEKEKKERAIIIPAEYWGTWIQMDTGDEYYINSENVYGYYYYNGLYIEQSGINGYTLESEDVLKKGSTVFFRKGGNKRSFSVSLSGFENSEANRAASTSSKSLIVKRQNKNNKDDNEEVENSSGSDSITFIGGVAEDPQNVTVTDGSNSGETTVTPKYDGENIGTIPVVEAGKYAFKTTYSINNAEAQGFMYGNNLGLYQITFNLTNVGSETCSTSVYKIFWDDSELRSSDLERMGNFSSIKSGNAKSITGTFIYGNISTEYKDVKISIEITDSKYCNTWYDSVTLRFYRGWVNLKINARNFNSSSSAELNGFIIYPDKRSQRFTVSSGYRTTVQIPWSKSDYYIVLSGASEENEMCYSFGFDKATALADLSGVWSISEINAYESNDTMDNAYIVADYTKPVKAYLKNEDIDYYRVNNSSIECSTGKLEYVENNFSDSTSIDSSLNNGDGKINPGETVWMDMKLHNTSALTFSSVNLELSTTSSYVTFENAAASYGDIYAWYYKTYFEYKRNSSSYKGASSASDCYYNVSYSSYIPFKFTVNSSCPTGTIIPFKLKITDHNGNEWTDTFSIVIYAKN